MKASYKLQLEQEQRRLGLSHKQLNKYDRKYNDINLIKYLQSLELVESSPPLNSGFWGLFEVTNQKEVNSNPRHMHAYLAYNDVPLTPSHQINSNQSHTFNVSEANRLPLPSSTLQLKITFQSGTDSVNLDAYTGFQVTGNTNNPLDQENTLSLLVNQNNYNNGQCIITFLVTYIPQAPPPHWTGNLTFIRTAGSGTQFINLRTEAGTLANNVQYTGANSYLVTLQNPQNYLEVAFDWSGYWEIGSVSFPNIPSPYVYIENYLTWYRYTIPSGLGNLTYNFTTFFND